MRFCPACGQKTATHRLTLHDIAHDSWHALTHTDHSVLGLVKALLLRPGQVVREYVDGRRKAWFNPFAFLIVVVGVCTLAMNLSGFGSFGGSPHPVARFLQQHLNLLILLQVPLLALFARLLFWRSANLAECLVLAAYSSGLRSIFVSLVMAPLSAFLRAAAIGPSYGQQVAAYMLLWALYFGWACAQFYGGRRWLAGLKGVLVAVAAQASSALLVGVAIRLVPAS